MKKIIYIVLFLSLFLPVISNATVKKTVKINPVVCTPDPALTKKVTDLTAQNTELQTQIEELLATNKKLNDQITKEIQDKKLTAINYLNQIEHLASSMNSSLANQSNGQICRPLQYQANNLIDIYNPLGFTTLDKFLPHHTCSPGQDFNKKIDSIIEDLKNN